MRLVSSKGVDKGHLSRDVTIFNEATGKKIFEIFQHARKPLLHNSRETFRSGGLPYEVLSRSPGKVGKVGRRWHRFVHDNPFCTNAIYYATNIFSKFVSFFATFASSLLSQFLFMRFLRARGGGGLS